MKYTLALVTGANSGLGKELCKQLAAKGIPLLITGRNEKELEELALALRNFVPVSICVADLAKNRKVLTQTIEEKSPDLIINSAGLGYYGNVLTHSREEELEVLEVNVNALVEICMAATKALLMQKRGGTILNVSSAAGFFCYPSFAIYSSSKAFVTHFSKSIDLEMRDLGIRVLCSCPGKIATPFKIKASKGASHSKDPLTIPVEKAARLMIDQIEKQKAFSIIDYRYRILAFIGRLLPEKWVATILLGGER